MKIIHTADIHLDSPLSGTSDPKTRRHELVTALSNLAQYANNNGVGAVIVAGDLFDGKFTAQSTVKNVAEIINGSKAEWFVLKGNHGDSSPYDRLVEQCDKVKTFGDDWTRYDFDNVTVCGRELGNCDKEQWEKLSLNDGRYNIVVLHGDIDDDSYGLIDKKALSASKANYVALGHRHAFSSFKCGRVKCCYCGVLEPRGFDETERTGFVEIDTDTDQVRFVPQCIRRVVTKRVDVSDVDNDVALTDKLSDAVADVDPRNYLNVEFAGAQQGLHIDVVSQAIEGRFFALRIADNTTLKIDLRELKNEVSLRGEFVRLVLDSDEAEDVKESMIKLGLAALSGEDLL